MSRFLNFNCAAASSIARSSRRAATYQHTSVYVSIRPHTSAYVRICPHTSAYVSIRQHTSAYVSIRPHTPAYVSIRCSCWLDREGRHLLHVNIREHTYITCTIGMMCIGCITHSMYYISITQLGRKGTTCQWNMSARRLTYQHT